MSVKVMGHVWGLDLSPNEKFVMLAYADHADHDGTNMFPSTKLIAEKTGYSERSVQRITKELVDKGILIPDGQHPKLQTNRWRYNWQWGGDKMSPPTPDKRDQGGVTSATKGGDKMSPDSLSTLTVNYPSIDNPVFWEKWEEWEKHRKEKRNSLTPTTRFRQLSMLSKLGLVKAIETIDRSITNGWTGLFPDKKDKPTRGAQHKENVMSPDELAKAIGE